MSLDRPPAAAGRFYPLDRGACERMLGGFLEGVTTAPAVGVVVPHAGWTYSGSTACLSMAGLAAYEPETIVLFGAVHVADLNRASLYPRGHWLTPLGPLDLDEELALRVARCVDVVVDPAAHRHEHSIEVELPIIKSLMPQVKIVPLMVRPGSWAAEVGRSVAREALNSGRRSAYLASTDLTHYGPAFGYEPHGHGPAGVRWAKEVNDRRIIDLVAKMDADAVVPEAAVHRNACGAGALAATIAAVSELGSQQYLELRHTTSAEVESGGYSAVNSVGYEAGSFVPLK